MNGRDPDEPTLAEIREKVEALYTVVDGLGEPRVLRDAVLALLEPHPKAEPKKRYVIELGSDGWGVWDTSYGRHGKLVAESADEHDARRIADALNATIITVGGKPLSHALVATLANLCLYCGKPIRPSTGEGWVHENDKAHCVDESERNTA